MVAPANSAENLQDRSNSALHGVNLARYEVSLWLNKNVIQGAQALSLGRKPFRCDHTGGRRPSPYAPAVKG